LYHSQFSEYIDRILRDTEGKAGFFSQCFRGEGFIFAERREAAVVFQVFQFDAFQGAQKAFPCKTFACDTHAATGPGTAPVVDARLDFFHQGELNGQAGQGGQKGGVTEGLE
jgi:hypothetical protein